MVRLIILCDLVILSGAKNLRIALPEMSHFVRHDKVKSRTNKMKTLLIISSFFLATACFSQEIKRIRITDLERTIKESKGPMIINFWATYCVPCMEEMPWFHELAAKYKSAGVSLLLVSLDLQEAYPKQIMSIAKKLNLTAPICWLDETNADYFCPKVDSNWSGGIPSSLFINNENGYRKFYEEQVPKEKLEKEIQAMLSLKR
jgi:thiol-disulfide isomerase/thioredoxin